MAQQNIIIGVADAGTGDDYFSAFTKTQANFNELFTSVDALKQPTQQVIVNVLADFPAPVAGIISLNQDTQYLIGADINVGTNTINIPDRTSVSGIESIAITLTYTGTGDMFTSTDSTIRVSRLQIICATGRFINWNDSLGKVIRLNDLGITCDRWGLITGVSSSMRLTNVSPTTTSTTGLIFSGTFLAFLYQASLANVTAGTLLDLGTSVFTSFHVSNVIATIPAGTTFLSGVTGSGNISVGGTGSVLATTITGTGTRLNNISVDDALWQFLLNDDIADTRPDGLLSLQGNAIATIIPAGGTYVLVAGVWTVERTSQMTGTTAGRLTYNGGKDATLPITYSLSVEPVSGTNKTISIRYASNGVDIASSNRQVKTDSGNPISIDLPWQDVLSTTNFVEVFVTSADGTNVLVSSGIARAN